MIGKDTDVYVDTPLISAFTHQIINPLNGIVGTLDNLIDGTISKDRSLQRLKAARAQLSHTIELVRNLAYLSQISTEMGRESLRNLGTSSVVPAVIIEAAMFFQEIADHRRMTISLVDRDTQYVVKGHPDLLRQVFTNLLENAVKYGYPGTSILICPHVQKKTDNLIIEVINNGPGFGYDMKEKIFERGVRGPEAKHVLASGSGIGLYICREILNTVFNAEIEAEHSPKKEETVFRIRFPYYSINDR
jgi:signal transduction histidine kinase